MGTNVKKKSQKGRDRKLNILTNDGIKIRKKSKRKKKNIKLKIEKKWGTKK